MASELTQDTTYKILQYYGCTLTAFMDFTYFEALKFNSKKGPHTSSLVIPKASIVCKLYLCNLRRFPWPAGVVLRADF